MSSMFFRYHNTDNYSEEQFDTWIENNEELVKKIKEKFDITVEKRTDLIEGKGQFTVKGGIIDVAEDNKKEKDKKWIFRNKNQ